jgi:outer membrane autotransporter protein
MSLKSKVQIRGVSRAPFNAGSTVLMALLLSSGIVRPAEAACSVSNSIYTCDGVTTHHVGNPQVQNHTVNVDGSTTVGGGATISTVNNPAISLGNGNTINVGQNTLVTNVASQNSGEGISGTGNNTIEFGANNHLNIAAGATVLANGPQNISEAINPRGSGNVIDNSGTIQSNSSFAIYFENANGEILNSGNNLVINETTGVINSGINQAIGGNGTYGINFVNKGIVNGNLDFFGNNNNLELDIGSTLNGNLSAGGGINTITLAGGPGSDSISGDLSGWTTLNKTGIGTWEITGTISGPSAVNVIAGTLDLEGDNSAFTGSVAVSPGATLQGQSGTLPATIADNGNTDFVQQANGVYAGTISGTGILTKDGAGTLALTGNETESGGTVINAGTLQIGNGGTAGSIVGNVLDNATLAFDHTDGVTYAGTISGTGTLIQEGASTLILTGDNTFTGATQINPGSTVQLGNGGTTGSVVGNVTDQGNLVFDHSNAVTYAGIVSGTGSLLQEGANTVTLTGNNTYTGGTTINSGSTLQLGNGGTSGSIVGNVSDQGALAFDHSNVNTFAGVISGTGSVSQIGTGTTILSGVNTYTGATSVQSGALGITGSIASPTTVAANATLGGTGTVFGNVTNAGNVAPGLLSNATPGSNFTVAGNYVGNGGTLTLNSVLGDDNSATDKLVISGAGKTATGTTNVVVNNVGGAGAATTNGILVVQATNGATIGANTFSLAAPVRAGAFDYRLFQGSASGAAATADDYYLRSTFVSTGAGSGAGTTGAGAGGGTTTVGSGGSAGTTGAGGATLPILGPEVSVYGAATATAALLGMSSLGTLHERVGQELNISGPSTGNTVNGAWGRVIGQSYKDQYANIANTSASGTILGAQTGVDLYRGDDAKLGGRDIAGVYFTYGHADTSINGLVTNAAATGDIFQRTGVINLNAYSGGFYATHFGPSGWYADFVAQGTQYSGNADSTRTGISLSGFGLLSSLEFGFPIQVAPRVTVEPEAQIVGQHVSFKQTNDAFSTVDPGNMTTLMARLGVRTEYSFTVGKYLLQPYATADVWSTLAGGHTNTVYGGVDSIYSNTGATWFQLGTGITAKMTQRLSTYAYVNGLFGLGDNRHKGTEAGLGVRYNW